MSTTSRPPDEPRNVLFIGSDRSDFETIERFLFKDRQGPIRAHWAKELPSALATLEKTSFAAILVDLSVLNYGGSGVLDTVRAAAPVAPIVVIAGAQSEPAARMALKRGAHGYLIKERLEARPFSHALDDLMDRKSEAGAELVGAGGKAATAARIAPQSIPSKIERRARGRRAEDKLQEQNARLDAALANMPHGLCMFDAERRLVLSNSRYAEMYSLPPNLLIPGTSLESIIAYRNRIGNAPLDFPGYASHDGIEFKQEGNSLFEFMLEDGRTIRVNHLVLKDGGYVATHEDITKAVLSEDRFRSIFDAISEGIFILDATTGTFIEVNEPGCLMLGYKAEELIGSDIQALSSGVPPYTQSEVAEWIKKAAATGRPQRFAWQSKTKAGRIFPIEVSMRFASIAGREVVLAIVRDLTERETIEAQLRQSQKMEAVGQLTGGMAHDFNNLLGVIIGNLELLREAYPHDPRIDELSGQALDAALGGADLTRRLLAFARRQPLQPQQIELQELVARTVKLLKRVLGENIEISLSLGDGACSVVADPAQLEAALTNLATNARDAMPRGGKLLIATGNRTLDADYAANNADVVPGEYAVIEVTDTGTGMPPEVMSHIFDPFYTTKERDKGTGLGLSMVFGFLKQSGGHISVYSEVGVGTTFRLYLPRATTAGEAEPVTQQPDLSASKGETVLVVEDNAPLRRAAVQQLRELGYRVVDVRNGSEALATLEVTKVDALFTDIVMPGDIDGFELARIAKKRWPELRVVLTSGYPETKLKENLASARFRLLNKPYRKAALARILREALDELEPEVAVGDGR